MIYLNDKLSDASCSKRRPIAQSTALINKSNAVGTDSVSFSGDTKNAKKNIDRNKLNAYIAAGIALAAGVIVLALNLKKGKKPSGDISKGIKNEAENLGKKPSENVTGGGKRSRVDSASPNSAYDSHQSTPAENVPGKDDPSLLKIAEIEAKINKQLDEMVEIIKPKDEKIAREAIPKLVDNREKLGIKLTDFNIYLDHITPENKDFVINEGIPFIADNMGKIKTVIKDPEKSHELLDVLNPENKNALGLLLDNAKILRINDSYSLTPVLGSINAKNIDLISKEVLPEMKKNPDNFKFLDSYLDSSDFIKLFNKENTHYILNDTLPTILKNSEKLMIKNSNQDDVLRFLKVITPENEKFVFDDLVPNLLSNTEKYKIKYGEDFLDYINIIRPENKEFMLNEAIPLINDYGDKLNITSAYNLVKILEHVTPENKGCITLIANNAEKLDLKSDVLNRVAKINSLLDKGEKGILEELKKD